MLFFGGLLEIFLDLLRFLYRCVRGVEGKARVILRSSKLNIPTYSPNTYKEWVAEFSRFIFEFFKNSIRIFGERDCLDSDFFF